MVSDTLAHYTISVCTWPTLRGAKLLVPVNANVAQVCGWCCRRRLSVVLKTFRLLYFMKPLGWELVIIIKRDRLYSCSWAVGNKHRWRKCAELKVPPHARFVEHTKSLTCEGRVVAGNMRALLSWHWILNCLIWGQITWVILDLLIWQ